MQEEKIIWERWKSLDLKHPEYPKISRQLKTGLEVSIQSRKSG